MNVDLRSPHRAGLGGGEAEGFNAAIGAEDDADVVLVVLVTASSR
jgi:hypothetical protein